MSKRRAPPPTAAGSAVSRGLTRRCCRQPSSNPRSSSRSSRISRLVRRRLHLHQHLNRFRSAYVQSLLEEEKGELTSLERSVIESLARHEILAQDVEAQFQKKRALGERLADRIADFGGAGPSSSCSGR